MLTNLIVCLVEAVLFLFLILGVLPLYLFWKDKFERDRQGKIMALQDKFGKDVKLISCIKLDSPFEEVGPGLLPELLTERLLKIWTPRQMKEFGSVILLWEYPDGSLHLSWYKEKRLFEERTLFHNRHSSRNHKIGVITHDLLLTLDLKLIPDPPSSE